jgi:hypothetical protein
MERALLAGQAQNELDLGFAAKVAENAAAQDEQPRVKRWGALFMSRGAPQVLPIAALRRSGSLEAWRQQGVASCRGLFGTGWHARNPTFTQVLPCATQLLPMRTRLLLIWCDRCRNLRGEPAPQK